MTTLETLQELLREARQDEHHVEQCETFDGDPFNWTTTYRITVDGMQTFRPGTNGNFSGEQVCRLMMEIKRDFFDDSDIVGWPEREPHWDCPFFYQAKRPGCDTCWIKDKKLHCDHKTEDEEIRFL